jgi:hypothetical protein
LPFQLDLTRAQSQLAQAKAQLDDVCAQRNLGEAIAELVGVLPSNFQLADNLQPLVLPTPPETLPSTLLQRRPDIAAAERRMFAANANIGVVRAAWYPDFSLTALLGGQIQGEGNLLSAANRYWALGPLINLPLFDGGRRSNQEIRAKAEYEEAAAYYHSQVLHAVREVEDNLGQLRDLLLEAKDEQDSFNAARTAEEIATDSYQAGAVSYLNVVIAQTTASHAQQELQLSKHGAYRPTPVYCPRWVVDGRAADLGGFRLSETAYSINCRAALLQSAGSILNVIRQAFQASSRSTRSIGLLRKAAIRNFAAVSRCTTRTRARSSMVPTPPLAPCAKDRSMP